MKIPNLRPNDKVAITAPAKRIARAEIDAAVKILISWGLQVVVGETIDSEYFQFSGTKEQRLNEVQNLLDDPDIKAIFFARGGYGSIQIIDDIDFSGDKPKLGPLASYVRDRRIPLELCPTSNLQTGAAKTYSEHPIGMLAKLRFRVTLNTDNRLMSRTSMSNEMSECVKSFGWKFADLQRVTVNALKSSFIPFEERLEIIEKVVKPAYAAISAE